MKIHITLITAVLLAAGCDKAEEKPAPAEPAKAKVSGHDALVAAVAECQADETCAKAMEDDLACHAAAGNLESCDVWKAIGCSALIATTAVVCVDPADGACEAAIAADKAAGCCDCIPAGPVRDLCNNLPVEAKAEAK
jgi:hypothetical protein